MIAGARRVAYLVVLAGLTASCAQTNPPATLSEDFPAEREKLARQLAKKGDLSGALAQWRVLERVGPNGRSAARERRKLEARIDKKVKATFAKAKDDLAKGRSTQAWKGFLRVVRLDPNHTGALAELQALEVRRLRRSRSRVVESLYQKELEAAKAETRKAAAPAKKPDKSTGKTQPQDSENPRSRSLSRSRDLIEKAAFRKSITALEQHLKSYPEDREAKELLSLSHRRLGLELYEEGRLREALPHLKASRTLGTGADAERVGKALSETKRRLAQESYEKGLRAFQTDVDQAIIFLQETLVYDPNHAKAQVFLSRARKIKETLGSLSE